jgi:predicted nucleic acid-binding protein
VADVLLDACCLLNLWSSGRPIDILQAMPHIWRVCTAVAGETLFVDKMVDGSRKRVRIDLQPWFDIKLLQRCQPEGANEIEAFVHFAASLDDGEAMCLALAKCRSWAVATDERKARRIAVADKLALLDTVQLVKGWADGTDASAAEIAEVIRNVSTLGRFVPRTDVIHSQWWRSRLVPPGST